MFIAQDLAQADSLTEAQMEKFLQPYDKEYMRMAMLKHEETFKQQVYELHRLYRIQKMLMRDIKRNRNNNARSHELWNSKNGFSIFQTDHMQRNSILKLDLDRAAGGYVSESNGHYQKALELIDESEIELTLGPTSYSSRRKKAETPLTSDSGPSFSSSSTGSSPINKSSSHQTASATRDNLRHVQVAQMTLGYRRVSNDNVEELEEQLSQERLKEQPPWLFQVLSPNMT